MTVWRNPRRLSEPGSDAPEVLRQALQQARASKVADKSVQRVADKLFPLIASGAITASGTNGAAMATRMSLFAKTAGLFAVVGLLSGFAFIAYYIYQLPPSPPARTPVAVVADHVLVPVPSAPLAIEQERRAPSPSVAVATVKEEVIAPDAGLPASTKVARPSRDRVATKKASPETKPEPALELALLKRAQQALETRPKLTMELVAEHEREYLHGIFAQEREILAIEALIKLNQRESALHRGRHFLRQYPDSAHVRRVYNLLKQYPAQTADEEL